MSVRRHIEIVSVSTESTAQRRHRERLEAPKAAPSPTETPELASAYRSLQLHWLSTVPGYREEIRRRINEAARARERRTRRVETKLGYEVKPRYVTNEGAQTRQIDEREIARGLRELIDANHEDVDLLGREIEGCG